MSLSFAARPIRAVVTQACLQPAPTTARPMASWLGAGLLSLCGLSVGWAQSAQEAAPKSAPPAASAPTVTPSAPATPAAPAVADDAAKPKPPVVNSPLDADLFYNILVAEVQANNGDLNVAYQRYLETARKTKNGQLYQRAVELAFRGRSPELALAAAKAWRQALPQSRVASEYTAEILLTMGRSSDLAAPLRSIIQLTPTPQQPQWILSLPRTMSRLPDKTAAAQVVDDATQPWRQPPLELAEAWAASAQGWLQARDANKSLAALKKAAALKPAMPAVGLVAIDLMELSPQAEDIVKQQLARPDAPAIVQLAYGRRLAGSQRFEESARQLEQVLKDHPEQMGTWITLAAVRLEMRQVDKAEAALQPVLQQAEKKAASAGKSGTAPAPEQADDQDDKASDARPDSSDIEQACLLMAQISEQRNNLPEALKWLDRVDPKHERVNIQGQRARLLVRQGRIAEARKLIRGLPETEQRDAVLKYQAEAQLLRDAKQPEEAYKVLDEATHRFPDDPDLLYDQAMLGEKLQKYAEAEAQLRKAMAIAPDSPNAFNALGYSLADRGVRLDEARQLVKKALELRPADPFIVDSLGWVEFRAGNLSEAAKLLSGAYQSRPDAEIAAHLGEVLWTQGKRDEALAIWRDALKRDADNDALKETLQRLQVKP